DPPATFAQALGEVGDALAGHCSNNRITPAVMFSGGLDSLVIYLALRDRLGAAGVRAITMQHNATNGPERAWPVSQRLGFEIEVLDNARSGEATRGFLRSALARDIIAPGAPHVAF